MDLSKVKNFLPLSFIPSRQGRGKGSFDECVKESICPGRYRTRMIL